MRCPQRPDCRLRSIGGSSSGTCQAPGTSRSGSSTVHFILNILQFELKEILKIIGMKLHFKFITFYILVC
jgi:hypothetical protein